MDQGNKLAVPLYQPQLADIEAENEESSLHQIDGALALAPTTEMPETAEAMSL